MFLAIFPFYHEITLTFTFLSKFWHHIKCQGHAFNDINFTLSLRHNLTGPPCWYSSWQGRAVSCMFTHCFIKWFNLSVTLVCVCVCVFRWIQLAVIQNGIYYHPVGFRKQKIRLYEIVLPLVLYCLEGTAYIKSIWNVRGMNKWAV
jgi:hypothetical protein